MRTAAELLDRLSAGLNAIALWGAILAVAVMVAASGWQVIARYVLAAPPIWTEELARYAMVWAGLLGASCAFRAKADPALFPNMTLVGGGGGALLALIRTAGVVLFIAPVIYFSLFGPGFNAARGYLARLSGRSAETMDVPMVAFGIAIPIAFLLIALHLAAALAVRATGGHEQEEKDLA
jgi:TRAP-type C4-dicarboxylate transport system permease small subunit